MIDLCVHKFTALGIEINLKKSCCLRVGEKHNANVHNITVGSCALPWKQELKYLGIGILSARRFSCNCQELKHKYFRALNGIFAKVGLNTSPTVLCSLINTFCVPILLYAVEAIYLNQKSLTSLENAFNQAFFKNI